MAKNPYDPNQDDPTSPYFALRVSIEEAASGRNLSPARQDYLASRMHSTYQQVFDAFLQRHPSYEDELSNAASGNVSSAIFADLRQQVLNSPIDLSLYYKNLGIQSNNPITTGGEVQNALYQSVQGDIFEIARGASNNGLDFANALQYANTGWTENYLKYSPDGNNNTSFAKYSHDTAYFAAKNGFRQERDASSFGGKSVLSTQMLGNSPIEEEGVDIGEDQWDQPIPSDNFDEDSKPVNPLQYGLTSNGLSNIFDKIRSGGIGSLNEQETADAADWMENGGKFMFGGKPLGGARTPNPQVVQNTSQNQWARDIADKMGDISGMFTNYYVPQGAPWNGQGIVNNDGVYSVAPISPIQLPGYRPMTLNSQNVRDFADMNDYGKLVGSRFDNLHNAINQVGRNLSGSIGIGNEGLDGSNMDEYEDLIASRVPSSDNNPLEPYSEQNSSYQLALSIAEGSHSDRRRTMIDAGMYADRKAPYQANQHYDQDGDLGIRGGGLLPSGEYITTDPEVLDEDPDYEEHYDTDINADDTEGSSFRMPSTAKAQNELIDRTYNEAVAGGDTSSLVSAQIGKSLLVNRNRGVAGILPQGVRDQSVTDFRALQQTRSEESKVKNGMAYIQKRNPAEAQRIASLSTDQDRLAAINSFSASQTNASSLTPGEVNVPAPEDNPKYGARGVPVGQRGLGPAQRFMPDMPDPILGQDRRDITNSLYDITSNMPMRGAARTGGGAGSDPFTIYPEGYFERKKAYEEKIGGDYLHNKTVDSGSGKTPSNSPGSIHSSEAIINDVPGKTSDNNPPNIPPDDAWDREVYGENSDTSNNPANAWKRSSSENSGFVGPIDAGKKANSNAGAAGPNSGASWTSNIPNHTGATASNNTTTQGMSFGNRGYNSNSLNWDKLTDISGIRNYDDAVFGSPVKTVDTNGEVHYAIGNNVKTEVTNETESGTQTSHIVDPGKVTIPENILYKAQKIASSAGEAAVTAGHMPTGDPDDQFATLKARIFQNIQDSVKGEVDTMTGQGKSPEVSKKLGEAISSVASHLINGALKVIGGSDDLGGESSTAVSRGGDVRQNAVHVSNAKMAGNVTAEKYPGVAEELAGIGLTPEDAANLPPNQHVVINDRDGSGNSTGTSFDFGQSGFSGGGGGGGGGGGYGNIYGRMGAAGSLLYGTYIMAREWRMATSQATQDAGVYNQWAAQTGVLAEYGNGGSLVGTEAGAATRQELSKLNYGQGAAEAFNGFSDVGYALSGNDALTRSAAELKGVAGVTVGTMVGGSMASMAAGSMAAAGTTGFAVDALGTISAVASPVALGVAIFGVLAVGGLEAYNAATGQNNGFGSIFKNTFNAWSYNTAKAKYGLSTKKGGIWDPINDNPDLQALGWTVGSAKTNDFATNINAQDEFLSPEQRQEMGLGYAPANAGFTNSTVLELQGTYNLTPDEATSTVGYAQRVIGGYTDDNGQDYLNSIAQSAASSGISTTDLMTRASQYATNMGLTPGAYDFRQAVNKYMGTSPDLSDQESRMVYEYGSTSETTMAQEDFTGQRNAQLGSQLQYYMPDMGQGNRLVSDYGLDASQTSSILTYSQTQLNYGQTPDWDKLAQASKTYTPAQMSTATSYAATQGQFGYQSSSTTNTINAGQTNSYVGGVVNSLSETSAIAGFDPAGMQTLASGAGMSNQQAYILNKINSGDVGAMSYNAWTTGSMDNRWQDMSGNSIAQYNGSSAMATAAGYYDGLQANAISGDTGARAALATGSYNWANASGGTTPYSMASSMLGNPSSDYVNAFLTGGFAGDQKLYNQKSYDNSMAGVGIQVAGVQLTQAYDWGSGTYNAPSSGSAWGIENQQVALQNQSQEANFSSQQQQMQLSNNYSIAQEQNQFQRMSTTQQFNSWQMDFSYQNSLQQEQWSKQNYNYSTQMNAMQYGYSMTDIDEQIRYSSGRQRKDLIRQRDEMTTTYSMETSQNSKTETEQEQVWAEQDEEYKKQKEYQTELNDLDLQSYNLNKSEREAMFNLQETDWARQKKEYEEGFALDQQARDLQRKYQADQLDLQLASAGVQAQSIKDQKEYNDLVTTGQKNWGNVVGLFGQLNTYDGIQNTANDLIALNTSFNGLKVLNIAALMNLIKAINGMKVPD